MESDAKYDAMALSTLETGSKTCQREKESEFTKTGITSLDNGELERRMGLGSSYRLMDRIMKALEETTCRMDKELNTGATETFMKDNLQVE